MDAYKSCPHNEMEYWMFPQAQNVKDLWKSVVDSIST